MKIRNKFFVLRAPDDELSGGGSGDDSFTGADFSDLDYDPTAGIDMSDMFGTKSAKESVADEGGAAATAIDPASGTTKSTPDMSDATLTPEQIAAAQAAAATQQPFDTPPKSWKAEQHEAFKALPPAVKQYVHEREQQALTGIMQYKGVVDQFTGIFKPFEAVMRANNIDPMQITATLAQNHHTLATGTREQKAQMAIKLLQSYQIDPADILEGYQPKEGAATKVEIPPEFISRLEAAERAAGDTQAQLTARLRTDIQAELDAFKKSPENPYYAELEDDIGELLGSGAAKNLREAYDIAKLRNPAVSAKVIKDLAAAEAKAAKDRADKAKGAKRQIVKSDGSTATPAKGSMDDTMNAILDKHYSS